MSKRSDLRRQRARRERRRLEAEARARLRLVHLPRPAGEQAAIDAFGAGSELARVAIAFMREADPVLRNSSSIICDGPTVGSAGLHLMHAPVASDHVAVR